MHDKFKKRHRAPQADDRVRRQIAREAARRMVHALTSKGEVADLSRLTEPEFYAAKRKAAAVLGHAVRPGDLPSDSEVREEAVRLSDSPDEIEDEDEEPEPVEIARMSDHIDRFAIYKMRLEPLSGVKQNPKWHPEGDALYHSLQVFERAREVRPFDEEFLTAALLHDVGKAIEPHDHVRAGLTALSGTLTPRTTWLVEHHMDLLGRNEKPISPRIKAEIEASEHFDDLVLLRDCDEAGREIGVPVPTVEEALAYLRGLEAEDYLEA